MPAINKPRVIRPPGATNWLTIFSRGEYHVVSMWFNTYEEALAAANRQAGVDPSRAALNERLRYVGELYVPTRGQV